MGRKTFGSETIITYPLDGSDVSSAPDNQIPASALQFQFKGHTAFGLAIGDAPVDKEVIVHTADSAGQFTGFHAQVAVPGSSASVDVTLKVNGVSVLTAPITLTNASGAGTVYNASFSAVSFPASARISIECNMSSNTGMSGLTAWVNGFENSQPQ